MDRQVFDDIYKRVHVVQDPEGFFEIVNIVEMIQPSTIVEIGTGGTAVVWYDILSNPGIYVGIDISEASIKTHANKMTLQQGKEVHFIQADSTKQETVDKLKQILNGKPIDFLFIDGDHSYEVVKQDIDNFSPLVREGGIVGFDDMGGATKAFNDLPGEEVTSSYFTSLVKKKSNISVKYYRRDNSDNALWLKYKD